MRIVCPGCAAAYEVPATRLSPRKMVRCARCSCEWVAVQETDTTDEADPNAAPAADAADAADPANPAEPDGQRQPALPAITAMDRLAAAEPKQARSPGLLIAWVLTFAALAGGAAAVVVWRSSVIDAWPPAGRVLGSAAHPATGHTPGAAADASGPAHVARERE